VSKAFTQSGIGHRYSIFEFFAGMNFIKEEVLFYLFLKQI